MTTFTRRGKWKNISLCWYLPLASLSLMRFKYSLAAKCIFLVWPWHQLYMGFYFHFTLLWMKELWKKIFCPSHMSGIFFYDVIMKFRLFVCLYANISCYKKNCPTLGRGKISFFRSPWPLLSRNKIKSRESQIC